MLLINGVRDRLVPNVHFLHRKDDIYYRLTLLWAGRASYGANVGAEFCRIQASSAGASEKPQVPANTDK